jgi:hypothetical protein
MRTAARVVSVVVGAVIACAAGGCGKSSPDHGFPVDDAGAEAALDATFGDIDSGLPSGDTKDPADCNEARTTKSYVGCEYYPTVTGNNVWSTFDYVVAVANVGQTPADVTVTGPNAVNKAVTVAPGALQKIYLPWVPSLKGPDFDACGSAKPMTASVVAKGGAYHLVSTSPVIVYQFNALEYQGTGGESASGGPKDWSSCPGNASCNGGGPIGCFSFSNDASMLLPVAALTGSYRVSGMRGWTSVDGATKQPVDLLGPYFTVTATQDATHVTVRLSDAASVLAGGGVQAAGGGETLTFTLDAGDVAEIVGAKGHAVDFSGSLVRADKPVQVLTGIPCINIPEYAGSCDHIEESVFPAETLGQHYIVTVPTSPKGEPVGHLVRLYGNSDHTHLAYKGPKPVACPATLDAGQVADCGVAAFDFEVTGDHEFAVASFMVGSQAIDPRADPPEGDPSQSVFAAVEQFRTKYLFLAPDDYTKSYVDIAGTADAAPVVDGDPVGAPFRPIPGGSFGVWRVLLGAGEGGAHTLTSAKPVGIQVLGYGNATSYQYPGGANLRPIAPPPK